MFKCDKFNDSSIWYNRMAPGDNKGLSSIVETCRNKRVTYIKMAGLLYLAGLFLLHTLYLTLVFSHVAFKSCLKNPT